MSTPDHPFHVPGLEIPRFLFRGFNKYSGGGFPGQNTTDGIVPLGFLQGCDQKMEIDGKMKPELVKARVRIHCCQHTYHPTPFSSWTHDWRTALGFARNRQSPKDPSKWQYLEDGDEGYIAVLDTSALGDERTLRNRIFHVPQFDVPRLHITCEWLIWGPVSGPAYRCVPFSAIRGAVGCREWPRHIPRKQSERYLLPADIRKSMLVAGCFQREDDTSADVMLAVAAAELAPRFWGREHYVSPGGDPETALGTEPLWPRDVLKKLLDLIALCKPVLSGRPLVRGSTALEGFPRVNLMYDLLSDAAARWRDNNSGTTWAPVNWRLILRESLEWGESLCERCLNEEDL